MRCLLHDHDRQGPWSLTAAWMESEETSFEPGETPVDKGPSTAETPGLLSDYKPGLQALLFHYIASGFHFIRDRGL